MKRRWFETPSCSSWRYCSEYLQYIQRNMLTVFALLCFVVVIHWLIFPYPSGLLHWHCGNLTIAPVPAKQSWWIWINTSREFIMNDCITTSKQSTTKPCAYFLGYTVLPIGISFQIEAIMKSMKLMADVFILAIAMIWPVVHSGEYAVRKFTPIQHTNVIISHNGIRIGNSIPAQFWNICVCLCVRVCMLSVYGIPIEFKFSCGYSLFV